MQVFLADVRHNYLDTLGTDGMPLGIAYMKAVMDRDVPEVASSLFVYPEALLEAIRSTPPDVLMLTNYMWNEALTLHFAKIMRQIRPDTLIVVGGPNVYLEDQRQIDFVRDRPAIDVYVRGEGDFVASEIVKQYLGCGASRTALAESEVPSAIYRQPDGTVVMTAIRPRTKALDDIPSPFLTGILDGCFDGVLAPMIETNRGCPFTCTFCAQGTSYYTKVNYFSVERVIEELDYIGRRVRERCPAMGALIIADPNYAMFERDVDISMQIAKGQQKYGWPTYISASTGKNRPDRIIKSLEHVNRTLSFRQSLQSTNPVTLRAIKRENIKLESYQEVMTHIRGRGMRSVSDLILGLPGESLETHLTAIRQVVDAGTDELHNFQLMLLKGTELESLASRARYRMETRFRVVPTSFGFYGGEPVLDFDEVVVATDAMTFDDYLTARKYALGFSVFWHNGWFQNAVDFAVKLGLKPSALLDTMVAGLDRAEGEAGAFMRRFIEETRAELFPDRQAAVDFYSNAEHLRRLKHGEIGNNLLYKYRAIASFLAWPAICEVGMSAIRDLLVESGKSAQVPTFEEFWATLTQYTSAQHAHGATPDTVAAPADAWLDYDIPRWQADGLPLDPRAYALPEPQRFTFRMSPEGEEKVLRVLAVHSMTQNGLAKAITRVRTNWQQRIGAPDAARPEAASQSVMLS